MKHLHLIATLLLIIPFSPKTALSQYNPHTNGYETEADFEKSNTQKIIPVAANAVGIPCNANSFWATQYTNGNVYEFTLINNVATVGPVVLSPSTASLAYCNNINGGSFSPTFYGGTGTLEYYDGTSWVPAPDQSECFNSGGNGGFIFYQVRNNSNYVNTIVRYNGVGFTPIFQRQDHRLCVADLAVDNTGNICFLTSQDSVSPVSDSIYIISPAGQVLKQYPFVLDCNNAYGGMIFNGVYYLAFGSGSSVYPHKLVPIIFTATTATPGTPIQMPSNLSFSDLESCNTGLLLSAHDHDPQTTFSIAPNHFSEQTVITLLNGPPNANIILTDVLGKQIRTFTLNGNRLTLRRDGIKSGMYFLRVIQKGKNDIVEKIIID